MVRAQIQLPERQYRQLKKWARRQGVSFSEAVRRCVAERLAVEKTSPSREHQIRSALAVCGKYADPDGPSRVAQDHDRHLGF
jgi:hypothetical protein